MGSKRAKIGFRLESKRTKKCCCVPPKACLNKHGDTVLLQAAWRARQQQAIDTRGVVAAEAMRNAAVTQRVGSNAVAARATIACNTALTQLDLSEHLRHVSDATARTAQADKRESEAAPSAPEEARGRAQAQEAVLAWKMNAMCREGKELRKPNRQVSRMCGVKLNAPSPAPGQSPHSLQDDVELDNMKNEKLETRLALAEPMLARQQNKLASLGNQVSYRRAGAGCCCCRLFFWAESFVFSLLVQTYIPY